MTDQYDDLYAAAKVARGPGDEWHAAEDMLARVPDPEDADFIALADPATITALIDENRWMREALDRITRINDRDFRAAQDIARIGLISGPPKEPTDD